MRKGASNSSRLEEKSGQPGGTACPPHEGGSWGGTTVTQPVDSSTALTSAAHMRVGAPARIVEVIGVSSSGLRD
ncbi:hypothetical protein KYC5002_24880 [Archangium violaceum]|uniref:hypothetical protein n=1 Tax=Archangium violaceum TaxID=83451 RepID=UPI002B2EF29A|nr:hypothetical protein KYC5002_24880 [Archangium gephyra]